MGEPALAIRSGADGSFSLWSEAFGEGFHSGRGALREARETFLAPSQLERFQPGERLTVVEVCVGTGCNLALLLEACAARGIALEWWGLELDPRPLRLALAAEVFRRPWQPPTLAVLERLLERGRWQSDQTSARMLWGDARQTLAELVRDRGELVRDRGGQVDLVWHDAFSPRRCPELWTVELLGAATALLAREGRWISYSSAAAVRETLRLLGLQLVALELPEALAGRANAWSGGTLASAAPLGFSPLWRDLSPMERDHLASGAGEPYRDPSGTAEATAILNSRQEAQAAARASGRRGSSSAWRRRWGVRCRGED
jgi:tRNA U34 5-methylaminomethyl-2-thiouridine-forming methyltransferase MnmC